MDTAGQELENNPSLTLSIKRKADEAFDALDDALQTKEGRPPPPKRANTSLYGSLAKYGIPLNKPKLTTKVPMPIFSSLLSRSRKAKKPTVIFKANEPTSAFTPDYSPGSTEAFLKRLATYHYSTYPTKPQNIDAVAASKAGWINEGGKDRLHCPICRVGWVLAGREGMSKEAAVALVEKQAQQLIEMHNEGCPWRLRQCDPWVYRIPLQSPVNLAKDIKSSAQEIEHLLSGIQIRHPLTATQVQSFVQVVLSVPIVSNDAQTSSVLSDQTAPASTNALLVSLFGWTLILLPPPTVRESSAVKLARTHSRSASVVSGAPSREGTPAPHHVPPSIPSTPAVSRVLSQSVSPSRFITANAMVSPLPNTLRLTQKDAMLQCRLCQRRLGLWAFAPPEPGPSSNATPPQRQLDVLREHRASCPYVAKSTPLPSFSLPNALPASQRKSIDQPDLVRSGTSLSLTETPSAVSSAKEGLLRTASFINNLRLGNGPLHTRNGSIAAALQESDLVEGWHAVYNTVMRYGMAERAGHRSRLAGDSGVEPGEANVERDNDDAMSGVAELVEQVKRNGSRQFMSYVRNLLG